MSKKISGDSVAPVLIFGYGNPSRGDDALGPMLLEQIAKTPATELLTDFQLQVEHSLDMIDRELVLFIDASVSCPPPFQFLQLDRAPADSIPLGYTTHTVTPDELIRAYRMTLHQSPPPSFLLTIRGEKFELGAPVSEAASHNLQQAVQWVDHLLNHPSLLLWQQALTGFPKEVA